MIALRARLAVALLLALLFPALLHAQDGWGFGNAQGGRSGFGPAQGTTTEAEEPALLTPADLDGVVAFWDAGDTTTLIKGGVDLVPADDDYYSRSAPLPLVSGGVPQYPISVVMWVKPDSTAAAFSLFEFSDNSINNRLLLFSSSGTDVRAFSSGGGGSSQATATSVFTAGRWTCVIATWSAANARAVYADTNTTGATETTSRAPSGVDRIFVGRTHSGSSELDGVTAYTAVLPVDLSGAGQASNRTAIFNGGDPETVTATTATALYRFDNDNGADAKGSFNLTASGSPVAQNNLVVMRDLVGTYHQRATTSAPTWDGTLYGGRGGAAFSAASSQFLVCESTPITAAPFQIYAVARSASVAATQGVLWIGDKDVTSDFWALEFSGGTTSDPIGFFAIDGASSNTVTSSGYSTGTTYLLWGLETSATSRSVRVDGGDEGTNTNDRSPDGSDRLGVGGRLDSTPSNFLDGSIGTVFLLNTASTDQRADVHDWVDTEFGTSLP